MVFSPQRYRHYLESLARALNYVNTAKVWKRRATQSLLFDRLAIQKQELRHREVVEL